MPRTVHTVPLNDQIEHDTDGDGCVCGPTIEAVPDAFSGCGWLVTHHSLDGRERAEHLPDNNTY